MAETQEFWWWMLAASAMGACFGSFANMLIHRLPRAMEMVKTPSHCPHCGTPLKIRHLIPLFSFLWQRGKCHHCGTPILQRYFWVEVITALSFALIIWLYGVTPLAGVLCAVALCLVIMVAVDLEHMIIPDQIQVMLVILGVLYVHLKGRDWLEALLCCVVGLALSLFLRQLMWWWKKREGLGLGDVKFFALVGLYITPQLVAPFCFLAGIAGILTALLMRNKEEGCFPFGPALALALFITIVCGSRIEAALLQMADFLVEFWLVKVNM